MSRFEREAEIKDAVKEAHRFIEKANAVLKDMKSGQNCDPIYYYGGSVNAAMKRASLDLSKALVKVRKPL